MKRRNSKDSIMKAFKTIILEAEHIRVMSEKNCLNTLVKPPVYNEVPLNPKRRLSLNDMCLVYPAEKELERLCMKNGLTAREAMQKSVDARIKGTLIPWYRIYLALTPQAEAQSHKLC